jgi:ribose 5-phosphate isomerase A
VTDKAAIEQAKLAAAKAAFTWLKKSHPNVKSLGVGSGSTVNYVIDQLSNELDCDFACASIQSHDRLQAKGISPLSLNQFTQIEVAIDGADQIDHQGQCIKGGGGAHTREKILAYMAKTWVIVVDQTKWTNQLQNIPITVEVIREARSYIARQFHAQGFNPVYRIGSPTDQGHDLLDIHGLNPSQMLAFADLIQHWPGIVDHGLFLERTANHVFIGHFDGSVTHHAF